MVIQKGYVLSLWLLEILLLFPFPSCDGAGDSGSQAGATTSQALVIRAVRIIPENPLSREPLRVEVDPPQPVSGRYQYRWIRNGDEILGEREEILESEHFRKGDRVEVEVALVQKGVGAEVKKSPPVTVMNSPPVGRGTRIEPFPAYSTDELKAVVEVFDADGDYLRFAYQWEKNGKPILEATGEVLSHVHFKKGDRIRYKVAVSDGEAEEIELHSKASVILNSPPRILSSSPGRVDEQSVYVGVVAAEDPDGDTITFTLSSAPEGMNIDGVTGEIMWKIDESQRGKDYEFKVIVSDTEGALAIQPITLNVSF